MDWSLAVHPYGNSTKHMWPRFFTFADLPQLAAWQAHQAALHNASNPLLTPQVVLSACPVTMPSAQAPYELLGIGGLSRDVGCAGTRVVSAMPPRWHEQHEHSAAGVLFT